MGGGGHSLPPWVKLWIKNTLGRRGLENVKVLLWLKPTHPDLRKLVKQRLIQIKNICLINFPNFIISS